jgi:HPt (histidine-containing phosphotransfer) domain-containing protein
MHNLTRRQESSNTRPANNIIAGCVCNMDYLTGVTRGNKKTIKSIVAVFFKETTTELRSLKAAITEKDFSAISSISHKIKSAFSLLGITVLKPVFDEMEKLGSATSGIERIAQLNNKVNMIFKQAKKELKDN